MSPPQVIIALDRSSTMDPRVEPIRARLTPALQALDPAVAFGFIRFPDGLATVGCCTATDVLVRPALNTADAIGTRISCNPSGGACLDPGPRCTPTDDVLHRVETFWPNQRDGIDRFVLLITDGIPINCNGEIFDTCRTARITASEMWRASRIKTVIFGIGSLTMNSTCLTQIALEGGKAFTNGLQTGMPYVWIPDVIDPKMLTDGIDKALSPIRARTCVVPLAGPRSQVPEVTVTINGTRLEYDMAHLNGWDFEPTTRTAAGFTEVRIWGDRCTKDILTGKVQAKNVLTQVDCHDCGRGVDCQ